MPIKFADIIVQNNRENSVLTSAFYHLMNSSDIDFSVDKILENGSETISEVANVKYIIRNASSSPISIANLNNNDIVRYNGLNWEIHKSVGNSETTFGIIYDKRTESFYQYDSTNGWKPLLRSGKIDGGTFS
jgi:hypothetical protein